MLTERERANHAWRSTSKWADTFTTGLLWLQCITWSTIDSVASLATARPAGGGADEVARSSDTGLKSNWRLAMTEEKIGIDPLNGRHLLGSQSLKLPLPSTLRKAPPVLPKKSEH